MPITDKQKELRKNHIGASETAAILGLSPWKTAYDVWLEKTGKLESDYQPGEAADIGNMVENSLLDWGAQDLGGVKIVKNQFRVHENGILSATHDALVIDAPEGLEAKTAGIMNPFQARDAWGEPGTDEIPDHYVIQCQHQCVVSGLVTVHVPALIGGRGRVMFHVARNHDICAVILERVTAFWIKNVQADIPPEGVPSLEIVRLRHREPGKVISLPAPLVTRWRDLEQARKQAEVAENEAKAAVLAEMADAEVGESDAGNIKITHIKSVRLDTGALKAAHPDIAAKFTKESESVRITYQKQRLLKG